MLPAINPLIELTSPATKVAGLMSITEINKTIMSYIISILRFVDIPDSEKMKMERMVE